MCVSINIVCGQGRPLCGEQRAASGHASRRLRLPRQQQPADGLAGWPGRPWWPVRVQTVCPSSMCWLMLVVAVVLVVLVHVLVIVIVLVLLMSFTSFAMVSMAFNLFSCG